MHTFHFPLPGSRQSRHKRIRNRCKTGYTNIFSSKTSSTAQSNSSSASHSEGISIQCPIVLRMLVPKNSVDRPHCLKQPWSHDLDEATPTRPTTQSHSTNWCTSYSLLSPSFHESHDRPREHCNACDHRCTNKHANFTPQITQERALDKRGGIPIIKFDFTMFRCGNDRPHCLFQEFFLKQRIGFTRNTSCL